MEYRNIELLSPARDAECGVEAINHGADAVYIGAPAFGARAAATNGLEDIERLARYAHLYRARVFATVNTLLFDDELDDCVAMIRRLYEVGVDALIVQDLGLLEYDLPPIELHASTQCHNADPRRIAFLAKAGFRRIVLARELTLDEIRAIRAATDAELEAFVHGALCVSYSGQCYMSQYLNGRSGNRGRCSQPCRATYDLYADRRPVLRERHLLSLCDLSAADSLRDMLDAGVTSFKIEGRLKDAGYVKNVTAHYRRLLDAIIGGSKASEGEVTYHFIPDIEKTFNRGYTDYFLHGRRRMASLDTQKSTGKKVGRVAKVDRTGITVDGDAAFAPGDGICHFDAEGRLQGFLVNQVQGRRIVPNAMPDIAVGAQLWRNHDQAFERQLQGRTAERKIGVRLHFDATDDGFSLATDDGLRATVAAPHQPANDPEKNTAQVARQLAKLGDSPYVALEIVDHTHGRHFLPTSTLNALRRTLVDRITERRIQANRPKDIPLEKNSIPYPDAEVDYRANIVNSKSEAFYRRHGVQRIQRGLEQTGDYDGKALMTTRYCLRHELGCCLQGKSDAKPQADIRPTDTLYLRNNEHWFRLEFDCRQCQMKIYKK